jgi:hypothetical protein
MVQSMHAIEDNKTQIIHIIERIEKINDMIALHTQHEADDFMIRQYQSRKSHLLQDLQNVLESLHIKAELSIAA